MQDFQDYVSRSMTVSLESDRVANANGMRGAVLYES